MIKRFEVEVLDDAYKFLKSIDKKHRKKITQNMERSQYHIDPKLFKKLEGEIWEFRTLFSGFQYRLLAFWDKSDSVKTFVFATHGIIKKTSKVDKKEIDKAEKIRQQYFKNK